MKNENHTGNTLTFVQIYELLITVFSTIKQRNEKQQNAVRFGSQKDIT